MKKILVSLLLVTCHWLPVSNAHAAAPWWLQPTVCRVNTTNCYPAMTGAGFDTEMWDAAANCRGMKLLCPDATVMTSDRNPTPVPKNQVSAAMGADFDPNVLNGDCFGARRTTDNGRMASVNGKFVRVWCNGTLDNPDEFLPNGEITFGAQPTCAELADNGFAAVQNSKCYGKYYDPGQYYIECGADVTLPARIIALNGATGLTGGNSANINYPTTSANARSAFDEMHSRSATQKEKYFK